MWSFRNNRLLEPVDVTVANLMAALGRYQGRQDLYQRQVPHALETLRQQGQAVSLGEVWSAVWLLREA